MLVMLGIPNCDTVRKARQKLEELGLEFQFRDLRKEELSAKEWKNLISQDSEGKLINTKSPNFRKSGFSKEDMDKDKNKLALLLEKPTLMKRPNLLLNDEIYCIGYDEEKYEDLTK
ncbi:MAG: arsenate reductase family protein [Bdellovibrionota bacterium]|nr:arsenate reductase family protein [Bdellovibrionota bacterium]